MTRNTLEGFRFADGEYDFAMPLPRIREFQEKTNPPRIGAVYARMLKGVMEVGNKLYLDPNQADWAAEDIVESIRQGLIGGGRGLVNGVEIKVTPAVADRLIQNYVLAAALYDHWSTALAILGTCVKGYDPPKAEPADERATQMPETEASTTA